MTDLAVSHFYLVIQHILSSIISVTHISSQQSSQDVDLITTNDVAKRLERLLSTFGSIW